MESNSENLLEMQIFPVKSGLNFKIFGAGARLSDHICQKNPNKPPENAKP